MDSSTPANARQASRGELRAPRAEANVSGVEQLFVLHECLVLVLVVRRTSPHWRRTEGRPEGPAQATACTGRLGVPDRERGRDREKERERERGLGRKDRGPSPVRSDFDGFADLDLRRRSDRSRHCSS